MKITLPIATVLLIPLSLFAQGLTPQDAIKKMKLPDGFSVQAVANEPMIRQPLSVSFDDRGRMWVLQYLQYPNPAGLKPVKQDQYLRTVWDRVPEPPPKGPKGLDRITICEDPDENGHYRKSKDFVFGLNLATGFCIGNGGVYVVQPPYLLYYPDKDRDDVPDGDPEVLLSGFGMEDTHSYANSLQWGPDGWLYGAHGSTVTAKIANPAKPKEAPIEFQQGIWRFHPKTKQFELFAEGGGNTYGLDFDKFGRVIAGTNYGGFAMLHQLQGAYYVKGFAKHGPLHNAHTYGYFDHVPYQNFKGGHVTCGGIVYQADVYPPEYRDQYIAGNLLSNDIYWHKMEEKGSTFTAKHGGDLILSNDSWCRPVDCFQGPDGCVYIADWYDKRAAHLDPIDNWDKTNGRVYRVAYRDVKMPAPFDIAKKSGLELVELLKNPNKWWRNEARRLIAERRDASLIEPLKKQLFSEKGLLALESLWALYLSGGFDEVTSLEAMNHPNEHVRTWAVRLIGDTGATSINQLQAMTRLAVRDQSPIVASQLACTAKRLDLHGAMTIAMELSKRDEFAKDAFIPLVTWWAIEAQLSRDSQRAVSEYLKRDDLYRSKLMCDFLVERIVRRIASAELEASVNPPSDITKDFQQTTALLGEIIPAALRSQALKGFEQAVDGRGFNRLSPRLAAIFDDWKEPLAGNGDLFRLRLRFNHNGALREAHQRISDNKRAEAERSRLMQLLGQIRRRESLDVLVAQFKDGKSEGIRGAALSAAQGFGDPKVTEVLLQEFPKLTGGLRQQAMGTLLSRSTTALNVLEQVESKSIDAKTIPIEMLRPALAFKNDRIDQLITKHWGRIGAATPGEKQARISWLGMQLSKAPGDLKKGQALFTKHCAACHTLFNEGGKVGPDLTTADRKNRGYLLAQIVEPSGYIRPEFISYTVAMMDGRRLSGLVVEPNDATVTLVNVVENKPVKTTVAKKDIEEMLPSATSLMPEKLLDQITDEEVRDLFAYLQSEGPKGKK